VTAFRKEKKGVKMLGIKSIPLQTWTSPVGSRILRLPDFKIIGI